MPKTARAFSRSWRRAATYPFGLKHEGYNSASSASPSYRYKYQGQELQETGFYDFNARMYMPDIVRTPQIDPLAEVSSNFSPYSFLNNNPLRFVDPTGMIAEDCPKCPKPSYEGQTMTGADGKNYGAARQQGDTAWDVPTKPLEWLGQTDIKEVTLTGSSKSASTNSPASSFNFSRSFGGPEPGGGGLVMMDSVWDIFGILLANSKPENKYIAGAVAVGAIALSKGRAADDVLRAESNLWKVGAYSELKGTQVGLQAHHVGQSALMKKMIEGYSHNTAPSILVPEVGHVFRGPFGRVSTNTSGLINPRQVLSRDIIELRRVYGPQGIPNSSLQELIQMNKTMYPSAFAK